ncbi:MAG: hypothetical protein FD153_419 [Rhodospirillaceae bacterium]|nr:MAG: hypothetical protein FD153_419 [Rhodospirillaceae bacterium]
MAEQKVEQPAPGTSRVIGKGDKNNVVIVRLPWESRVALVIMAIGMGLLAWAMARNMDDMSKHMKSMMKDMDTMSGEMKAMSRNTGIMPMMNASVARMAEDVARMNGEISIMNWRMRQMSRPMDFFPF